MLVINDPSSLSRITVPEVRALIRRRMDEYGADADLATFVFVEPGDPIESLDAQLGFSILTNRLDGRRHGDPEFRPSFELAEDHGGFFELVFVLADYGDGVLVFVPKGDGVDPLLLSKASFVVPDLQDAFKSCWHVRSSLMSLRRSARKLNRLQSGVRQTVLILRNAKQKSGLRFRNIAIRKHALPTRRPRRRRAHLPLGDRPWTST